MRPAMRLLRLRFTVRRMMVAVAIVAAASAVVWCAWPRGFTIKVVNRSNSPMERVQLVLGDGRQLELASIHPGGAAGAILSRREASDVRLVYQQPDGHINDLLHVSFPPGSHPM